MNDLYGEEKVNNTKSSNPIFIEFDFSKEKTLFEMINTVKLVMSDSPSNPQIYIVCGKTVADNDYDGLINFLRFTYPDIFNNRIFIRGYIHYDFIHFLAAYKCIIIPDTKIVHDVTKTHKFLYNFSFNPSIQNKFIQRFNSSYYDIQNGYFKLDELTNLGLTYEAF